MPVDVAVVTAAYLDTTKKVEWLAEAGRSILGQSIGSVQWVVVDDCSPLEPELPDDPRIIVRRAVERQGPAACRNTAAFLAESEALIALDADDVLAGPNVLLTLFDAWRRRPDRFYYGNLQLYNNGVPGKLVEFPVYNFVATLDPKGLVPVTGLVSKEAWYKAGGWKNELAYGLEDVEFWIAVGKAGFCGFKLDLTTILYRKHGESRTAGMRANGAVKEKEMRDKIRDMHTDLYEGRLPMGCCGGGRGGLSSTPLPISGPPRPRALAPSLNEPSGGTVWVRYNGGRQGEFFIRGKTTGAQYTVPGTGAEFQIYAQDAHFFSSLGKGKDFSVGISAPVAEEPKPDPPKPSEVAYTPPPPPPATIFRPEVKIMPPVTETVRYEEVKAAQEAVEQAAITLTVPSADEIAEVVKDHPLAELGASPKIQKMLEVEGWTLPQLARAIPEELVPYPGIGKVTAQELIAKAKALWQP